MAVTPRPPLSNVTNQENLKFYHLLSCSVELLQGGTAESEFPNICFKFLGYGGDYNAATTDPVVGVVHYLGEDESPVKIVTVIEDGRAIVQIEPGTVVAVGDPLSSAPTGNAVVGTPNVDYVAGYALNASDGSGTLTEPHYTMIKIAG